MIYLFLSVCAFYVVDSGLMRLVELEPYENKSEFFIYKADKYADEYGGGDCTFSYTLQFAEH